MCILLQAALQNTMIPDRIPMKVNLKKLPSINAVILLCVHTIIGRKMRYVEVCNA